MREAGTEIKEGQREVKEPLGQYTRQLHRLYIAASLFALNLGEKERESRETCFLCRGTLDVLIQFCPISQLPE